MAKRRRAAMPEPAPSFSPPYWDADAAAPRFKMGARVRVLGGWPPGHCRTPWYARGKIGVVERVLGHFANPEELAYGRDGLPKIALYRVRFALSAVWPNAADGAYRPSDTVDIEIYEPWLEPFFDYAADPDREARKVEQDIGAARLP